MRNLMHQKYFFIAQTKRKRTILLLIYRSLDGLTIRCFCLLDSFKNKSNRASIVYQTGKTLNSVAKLQPLQKELIYKVHLVHFKLFTIMDLLYLFPTLISLLGATNAKPQIPEGLGDTISSFGSSAADLIRYWLIVI